MKSILLFLLVAAVAALALKLLVLQLEARMAFFPVRGLDVTPEQLGVPFDEITVGTADGETIHLWHLPHPDPRAEVLYFHGNGGNLSIWAPVLVGVRQQGLTVVALDYRGYGRSTGSPSEQGLYRDTEAAVRHFWRKLHQRDASVVYWGRSLGATMAAYASTVEKPDALLLESGFPDKRALLGSLPLWLRLLGLLSGYEFPTAGFLRGFDRPVLVIHGDTDEVVPFELGEELFERLETRKRFHRVSGGGHNDVLPPDAADYWRAVGDFIGSVRRRPSTG